MAVPTLRFAHLLGLGAPAPARQAPIPPALAARPSPVPTAVEAPAVSATGPRADEGDDKEKDRQRQDEDDAKKNRRDEEDEEDQKRRDREDEDDEDESKGETAMAQGRRRERARCAHIFESPAAAGRPDLAAHFAFGTRLGRHAARAALETAAAGHQVAERREARRAPLGDRMADAHRPAIGAGAGQAAAVDPKDPKARAAFILAAGARAAGHKPPSQ